VFVMAPVQFILPSVYYATESLSGTLTLLHVLEDKNLLTKFFALRQMEKICTGNVEERKIMYALSQPGGHPRNWNTLRDIAFRHLQLIHDRFTFETHCKTVRIKGPVNPTNIRKVNGHISPMKNSPNKTGSPPSPTLKNRQSPVSLNELYQAKQSFFLPPSLKPRSQDAFLNERKTTQKLFRMPTFIEVIVDRIRTTLFEKPPLIPSYETSCVIFIIRSVSSVVAHSIQEDAFGVMQKDLKSVIGALARLSIAIDAYIRASGLVRKACMEQNIYLIDMELAMALTLIRNSFGPHMSDVQLNPIELEVIRTLA